jgi:hypothetical protein
LVIGNSLKQLLIFAFLSFNDAVFLLQFLKVL